MPRTLLVVSAHSADFVWRAAGAIATVVAGGRRGARGRALVRRARRVGRALEVARADRAAGEGDPARRGAGRRDGARAPSCTRSTWATTRSCWTPRAIDRLTELIRELEPHLILTHAALDPFNPDHGGRARRDRAGAAARERRRGRERVRDDRAARAAALRAAPARAVRLRADDVPRHHAGLGAEGRGDGGDGRAVATSGSTTPSAPSTAPTMRGASRVAATSATPRRSSASCPSSSTRCDRLSRRFAELGVATVHEAAGRVGVVDLDADAGRARLARRRARADALCAPGDNTMVHAAVAHASPGDVLVLTSREPAPGRARRRAAGDAGAARRGSRGSSSTAPCATSTSSRTLGLPIWARCRARAGRDEGRGGRARRAGRRSAAPRSAPGDLVVLDCDGAMALPAGARRRGARRSRARACRAGAGACASATRRASSPTT